MWPESEEKPKQLKTGLTTGCCATACSVAAAYHLLDQQLITISEVTLPRGKVVTLEIISNTKLSASQARAEVIKDAGDDPDATHGATVFVELSLIAEPGIVFKAASGVGTVTKTGLALAVGEPAINPVPRKMITDHLTEIAQMFNYAGGFEVAVGVVNGEEIALKTMNGRLGILGGLSILGVSGIVRPFSCSAYIASIYQGIDVAASNGFRHIAASTGNSSEAAIKAYYQLPDTALIEMGDFAGAVIKQLNKVPMTKLSLCGGIGKVSKLAQGKWNLHSKVAAINFEFLAQLAAELGGDDTLQQKIIHANTTIEALQLCYEQRIDLASAICQQAYVQLRAKLPEAMALEVWAINRQGQLIGFGGVNTP